MAMASELRTARLTLRLLGPADAGTIHALHSDEGHTIGDGPISDPRATATWLERRRQLHVETGLAWYGLWDSNEALVGTCGAFYGRCGTDPEVGYEIALPRRRRGFSAEALDAVTTAAHVAGHPRIWATIRPSNIPSVQAARASGFTFVYSHADHKGPLDYYLHAAMGGE